MQASRYTKVVLTMSQIAMLLIGSANSAHAQNESRHPLIGTWTLNAGKSVFRGNSPTPTNLTRTFDYTKDGLILVTLETVGTSGRSFIHWYLGLDGAERPSYSRKSGAEPTVWASARTIDPHTIEVIDRMEGQEKPFVIITFAVSKDGETMTMNYVDMAGTPGNIVVYDKVFS